MDWQGITITADAAAATHKLIEEDKSRADQVLRLWLEGKGCDGFYYGINFIDGPDERDFVFKSRDISIVVDPDTLEFVDGSEITWIDDERGRGYLVENPGHKKFRGKFYKRKQWQDRLEERQQERSE